MNENSKQALQILKDAKARLQNPQNFCKNHYAVDKYGISVSPANPDATRWCAMGSMSRTVDEVKATLGVSVVDGFAPSRIAHNALSDAAYATPYTTIVGVNDYGGRINTLAMFNAAIEAVKKGVYDELR